MEELNMRTNEIEETEYSDEIEESSDGFDVLPLLLAYVGGIATPFIAKGVKKFATFAKGKWDAKRRSAADDEIEDAEVIEVEAFQKNANTESADK